MSYQGQTLKIDCSRGGFTHNPNIDNIDPVMMVEPTRNLNLHRGVREPRGGTSHVNESAVSGTPVINGVFDYTLKDGTQFILLGTSDSKIYKNFSATIKTGLTSGAKFDFEVLNEEVYICTDGSDRPQVWDGAAGSTSDLADVPTDWSGSNTWPTQLIKHGKGNSERLWALGVGNNPYTLYSSANNDGVSEADFSDANVLTFHIETGDGDGLVGGVEFGDRLIVFGKRRAYVIDDTDADTANWGYQQAQWDGGVAHHRLIVRTPNDIVCMMDDGTIYSVTAVESYGDYKAASLTRPAFIDRWIKEFVDLTKIADFHAEYDPNLRAIKFFVIKKGKSEADTALIYFVDRGPQEGWMIHDNTDNASGYSAASSALIKVSDGDFQLYTGDYTGFVWQLETANINDNNAAYYHGFRTPDIPDASPREDKKYRRGWLVTQPEGNFEVQVKVWVNSAIQGATRSVSLSGTGAVLGSFELGTDVLGGDEIIDTPFDVGARGKRIKFEIFNTNVNEDFKITELLYDRKAVGSRPNG